MLISIIAYLSRIEHELVLILTILMRSAIKIPAVNPEEVAFTLVAIVDPVSRGAQKLGPILKTLQHSLNCNVKVFLNCLDKNSDMPLKRYTTRFLLPLRLLHVSVSHIVPAFIDSYLSLNYNSPSMVISTEPWRNL